MIPINRNVKRQYRYHGIPLNVKRRRPNVDFLGIELDSDDLLTEILLRLPVKSLYRFKSVCKKWQSIISSDYFCHQHTLRQPRLQPSLILRVNRRDEFFYLNPTSNGEKKMIPYRTSFPLSGCTIVLACNGLLLLQSPGGCYYVHNLTTRRSRKIVLNRKNEHPRLARMGLAFDPSKSPYYKIICVYPSNPEEDPFSSYRLTYEIEVYDSESHSWKLGLEAESVPILYSIYGRHWNNKIYWWTEGHYGYCYFDIDKNEMKTLSFPETAGPLPGLLESNGHLYHCGLDKSTNNHCGDDSVAVWELVGTDDGRTSPWLLKHRALVYRKDYNHILTFMAGLDGDEASDGDETCSLLTHTDGKIRVYSFPHEDFIDFLTLTKDRYFCVACFQFGETLALV